MSKTNFDELELKTPLDTDNVSSGSATDGQVLTANGAGGADWEEVEITPQLFYAGTLGYLISPIEILKIFGDSPDTLTRNGAGDFSFVWNGASWDQNDAFVVVMPSTGGTPPFMAHAVVNGGVDGRIDILFFDDAGAAYDNFEAHVQIYIIPS